MKTYTPEWKDMVGVAKRFTYKNLWRLEALGYEFEDGLQDCYLKFHQCKKNEFETKKQFCTYFVTALLNHFNTLSNTSSKKHQSEFFADEIFIQGVEEEKHTRPNFIVNPDKDKVKEKVINAPMEVKRVVNVLLNLPSELFSTFLYVKQGKVTGRLSNQLLCSLVGVDETKTNLRMQLLKYFK